MESKTYEEDKQRGGGPRSTGTLLRKMRPKWKDGHFFCSNASIALARSLCKCLLAVLITAGEASAVAGFPESAPDIRGYPSSRFHSTKLSCTHVPQIARLTLPRAPYQPHAENNEKLIIQKVAAKCY